MIKVGETVYQCIPKQELIHRLCNGFISHDGRMPHGRFVDLWKDNGYDVQSEEFNKIMEIVGKIIDSISCRNFVETSPIVDISGDEFCGSCGHIVKEKGMAMYCSNCGAKLIRKE